MIHGVASIHQNLKIGVFLRKIIFGKLWFKKDTSFILPTSCSSYRDASNEQSFDLKRLFWKVDLRSMSWVWPDQKSYVAYRRSDIVDLNTSNVYFHCSNTSLWKVVVENCWGPFKTWGDLGDVKRGRNFLVAIFLFSVSSFPVTRCLEVFRMVFVRKGRFQFSPIDR